MAAAAGPLAAPVKPVPKMASTTTSAISVSIIESSLSAPASSVAGRTSTPSLPRMSRFSLASPLYSSAGREQEHGDLDARVEELARDHEAVPAVVALAGEDHGLLGRVALEDLGRHGEAGALHEVPAGDADAVDGQAVDLLHAVGGVQAQQQGLIHPRPP